MRKHNTRFGAGKNQFGVKMGDIRKIVKALKGDHDLALELWKTKNLLDRIEAEVGDADPAVRWTMDMCLAEIGAHFEKLRKRAVKIGEDLALYRDYPVPKGCTSPFAPEWIRALVERHG